MEKNNNDIIFDISELPDRYYIFHNKKIKGINNNIILELYDCIIVDILKCDTIFLKSGNYNGGLITCNSINVMNNSHIYGILTCNEYIQKSPYSLQYLPKEINMLKFRSLGIFNNSPRIVHDLGMFYDYTNRDNSFEIYSEIIKYNKTLDRNVLLSISEENYILMINSKFNIDEYLINPKKDDHWNMIYTAGFLDS